MPRSPMTTDPRPVAGTGAAASRAARTAPVRPAQPGGHWRASVRTPAFWMLLVLFAVGAWRIVAIMRPAAVEHPIAMVAAVVLFSAYAVPFVLVTNSLDYLEREPPPLLLSAVAWGALVAVGTAVPANVAVQQLLAKLASPSLATTWGPAIAGPTVEEPLKMLGVVVIVLVARQHINSLVDGCVYGAFVGLGFQVVEDMMYSANAVDLAGHTDNVAPVVATFLLRGFLGGLWSHTVFSAVAGAGVAFVVLHHERPLWTSRLVVAGLALLAAWGFHFVWNSPWLADGFGYGAVGVVLALVIKGAPALLLCLWLVRNAGRREAAYYTREISELHDLRLGTPRELDALGSARTRAAARHLAHVQHGRDCARAVRRLQRTQALLAVELSRGGDGVDRYRADLLLERDRLVRWGHPEAYAPNTGTPWLVWAGGSLAAGALAILLAVVIRALGGA
jgi:RsiW-degrading membrane proteinase PrsW (M82 family)